MTASESANLQTEAALRTNAAPPRRFNRGTLIRFVLAVTPTVAFAIIGAIEQHLTSR